jgi:hypothetical protein
MFSSRYLTSQGVLYLPESMIAWSSEGGKFIEEMALHSDRPTRGVAGPHPSSRFSWKRESMSGK